MLHALRFRRPAFRLWGGLLLLGTALSVPAPARAFDDTLPNIVGISFGDCNDSTSTINSVNTATPLINIVVRDLGADSGLRLGRTPRATGALVRSGTELFYNFDEAAGTDPVPDLSLSTNTGIIHPGAGGACGGGDDPCREAGMSGFGSKLSWTSGTANRGIRVPASALLASTTDRFTLQAWIRLTSDGGNTARPIFQFQDAAGNLGPSVWVNRNGTNNLFADYIDTPTLTTHQFVSSNNVVTYGQDHLITATYNGNVGRLYVDNNPVGSLTLGALTMRTHFDLLIGSATGVSWFGSMDEVRVMALALSQTTIEQDFYAGRMRVFPFGATGSTLAFITEYTDGDLTQRSIQKRFGSGGLPALTAGSGVNPARNRVDFAFQDRAGNTVLREFLIDVGLSSPSIPTFTYFFPNSQNSIDYNWSQAAICTGQNPRYDVFDCAATPNLIRADVAHPPALTNDGGLAVNTKIGRRIRAKDNNGTSSLSDCSETYTDAATPAAFTVSAVSSGSMLLSWNDNGNPNYTRYELGLWNANYSVFVTSPIPLGAGYTSTAFGVGGLTSGTTYFWRLRAHSGTLTDSGVRYTSAVDLQVTTLTGAPTLSATAEGVDRIRWTWTAVPGAASYALKSEAGATLYTGGELSFLQTGLSVNTANKARILAQNSNGDGAASDLLTRFTLASAPTGTAVTAVSSRTVSLSWTSAAPQNPAGTLYQVFQSSDSGFGGTLSTASVTGTATTIGDLLPDTTYFFLVRAQNGDGLSTAADAGGPKSAKTSTASGVTVSSAPATIYASTPGAVGIWHLDDGAGLTALDASGAGNHGSLTCTFNGCTSTPTFVAGFTDGAGQPVRGAALRLTGNVNSFLNVPHSASLNSNGALTVEAWANPASALQPANATLIAKGDGSGVAGDLAWALDISGGLWRFLVTDTGGTQRAVSSVQAPAVNQWTHVAGVFDPSLPAAQQLKIYVNGALSATGTGNNDRRNNAHALTIGSRQSTLAGNYDGAFQGSIDEVRVIHRALNAADVAAEYNAGLPAAFTAVGGAKPVLISVPPNAFGEPVTFFVSQDPQNNPLPGESTVQISNGLSNPPTGFTFVPGTMFQIVARGSGGQIPSSRILASSVAVSLPYEDSDGNGLVDGTSPPIEVSKLRVFTLKTSVIGWDELSPTTLDTANRRVTALTSHFSVFALFASSSAIQAGVSGARVFPVPWKPDSGTRFDSVSLGGKVGLVFDQLPTEGNIRIFTLAGQLVTELPFDSFNAGRVIWDGKNRSGRSVASGVYFAYVRAGSASRMLKFAIER